jgi:hypothetical protein
MQAALSIAAARQRGSEEVIEEREIRGERIRQGGSWAGRDDASVGPTMLQGTIQAQDQLATGAS